MPCEPQAIARAFGIPSAHTLIVNPGGSLTWSIWIWLAGVGAGGRGTGASGELAMSAGWPCFHAGGRLLGGSQLSEREPDYEDHRERCHDDTPHGEPPL